MSLEITPCPSAEERAAIVTALERLHAEEESRGEPPAWWLAGVLDSLDDEAEGSPEH